MDLYDHSILKASENIVSAILLDSIKRGASDIHIEPEFMSLKVRYRVYGVMQDVLEIPASFITSVINDVKEKAGMAISSAPLPREGKIRFSLRGEEYRFTVSLVPVLYGERAVLHRIDYRLLLREQNDLGIEAGNVEKINRILSAGRGLLVITGKLGDGRTTTALNMIQRELRSGRPCVTFESARSYEIDGLPQYDMGDYEGLQRLFSDDPVRDREVVLIDETISSVTMMRAVGLADRKVVIAVTRAPDTASAIFNTVDMGVDIGLIKSGLAGVLSQRMIKELCCNCMEKYSYRQSDEPAYDITDEEKELLLSGTLYRSVGCERCYSAGYTGVRLLDELVIAGDELNRLIDCSGDRKFRREEKRRRTAMYIDRYSPLCHEGVTTVSEIARILELPQSAPA